MATGQKIAIAVLLQTIMDALGITQDELKQFKNHIMIYWMIYTVRPNFLTDYAFKKYLLCCSVVTETKSNKTTNKIDSDGNLILKNMDDGNPGFFGENLKDIGVKEGKDYFHTKFTYEDAEYKGNIFKLMNDFHVKLKNVADAEDFFEAIFKYQKTASSAIDESLFNNISSARNGIYSKLYRCMYDIFYFLVLPNDKKAKIYREERDSFVKAMKGLGMEFKEANDDDYFRLNIPTI